MRHQAVIRNVINGWRPATNGLSQTDRATIPTQPRRQVRDQQRNRAMRDRRGLGIQAYLPEAEEFDMEYSGANHSGHASKHEGGAPPPASEHASEISYNHDAETYSHDEPSSLSPANHGPDHDAHAPAADAAPAEQGGTSEAGLNGQAPSPSAPTGAPANGGPAPIDVEEAGSAAGSAPVAAGGGAPSSYAGDDMGWDMAAFAEAGGYDAVIMGAMPPGMCPGEGGDIFLFIDELNVEINNTEMIQNTEINLIADDGSVLEIEGDFTAITTQESVAFQGPASSDPFADGGFLPEEPVFIEAEISEAA